MVRSSNLQGKIGTLPETHYRHYGARTPFRIRLLHREVGKSLIEFAPV